MTASRQTIAAPGALCRKAISTGKQSLYFGRSIRRAKCTDLPTVARQTTKRGTLTADSAVNTSPTGNRWWCSCRAKRYRQAAVRGSDAIGPFTALELNWLWNAHKHDRRKNLSSEPAVCRSSQRERHGSLSRALRPRTPRSQQFLVRSGSKRTYLVRAVYPNLGVESALR